MHAAFALPDFTTTNVKTGEIIASNGTFADTSHKGSLSKFINDINAIGLQVRDVFTTERNFFQQYHRAGFGLYSNAVTTYTTIVEVFNTDGEEIGRMEHYERHETGKVTITQSVSNEEMMQIRGMRNVAWITGCF